MKKELFRTIIIDASDGQEHVHHEVILLFVLEGILDVSIEEKVSHLKREDLLVINANKRHEIHPEGDVLFMLLLIDYGLIADTLKQNDVLFWCDSSSSENASYKDLRSLVRRMLNHYVEAGGETGGFSYLSDCYAILNTLTANFMIRMERKADSAADTDEDGRYEERIRQINDYIFANYDQPISMKELSEKLYLSNGYLYRFFKKNYGMSFASYLTGVRVRHAADDLLHTSASITQIAYSCGFTSSAVFNKEFKSAYGVTPSEFRGRASREKFQKDSTEHKEELQRHLERLLVKEETVDPEVPEIKTVSGEYSAAVCEPTSDFWGKIINFGAAPNLLRSSVREQLALLHRTLGFEYVRIYNIFSKKLYIDPARSTDYNFSQIDSVLDFILEQGMKPFIDLGMRTSPIHYGIGHDKVEEPETTMDDLPLDLWEDLMQEFLWHLEDRYGAEALSDWRMELWYDETWRMEPERNNARYLSYFDTAWRLIKQLNTRILFGGYGIRGDRGEEQRALFLRQWNRSECRPDFISAQYYGYERQEDGLDQYARRNPDLDAMLRMMTREKQIIREAGFTDVPIIINEWNLTPSVRNYINDTTFKAAYIVKNTIDIYGMVDALGYGDGSDSTSSFYDTTEILFGGGGLMTAGGIMKPAAFACEFFNRRLMPLYLGKSSNFIVTADGHDGYAILCHNMQNLNYNYYLTSEAELDKTAMWKYYEGRTKLNVRILIRDIKEGEYKLRIYRINEDHGNLLKTWGNLNFERNINRSDMRYFQRMCEPDLKIRMAKTQDKVLMLEEQMKPNEIMLIHVYKVRKAGKG